MKKNCRALWKNTTEKSNLEFREGFTEEKNILNDTTIITRICLLYCLLLM